MNKISELISKEVVSIFECERIGTICGVCFNQQYTKIKGYIFFNDETDLENYINTSKIYTLSQEGIFIKNTTKIDPLFETQNSPINKKVFTISGKDYGKINDVIIDDNSNVIELQTNKGQKIDVKNIINIGEDMIILKENDDKINIGQFKPKSSFPVMEQNEIKVKIVPIQTNEKQNEAPFPVKMIANTNNIIGKKAKYTIFGMNKEIIIRENQIISDNTLKMAKLHNKINELMYATI